MPSLRARLSAQALSLLLRPRLDPQQTPEDQRRALERFSKLQHMPRGVATEAVQLGARPALKFTPRQADAGRTLLYLHGGAYCIGSPAAFRVMTAQLALSARCTVYSLDYRLAPEHPYPAALDDALAAYHKLAAQHPAARIALAGDSAGAGLALVLAQQLPEASLPMAACLLLFCPFADLGLSGASLQRNRHREPLLTREWLALCSEFYAAETPREDPRISPLYGRFDHLPPMLIQAAGNDLLLDDARRLHATAREAGAHSKLEVFADLGHDFQVQSGLVPEARRALVMAGAFAKAHQQIN